MLGEVQVTPGFTAKEPLGAEALEGLDPLGRDAGTTVILRAVL